MRTRASRTRRAAPTSPVRAARAPRRRGSTTTTMRRTTATCTGTRAAAGSTTTTGAGTTCSPRRRCRPSSRRGRWAMRAPRRRPGARGAGAADSTGAVTAGAALKAAGAGIEAEGDGTAAAGTAAGAGAAADAALAMVVSEADDDRHAGRRPPDCPGHDHGAPLAAGGDIILTVQGVPVGNAANRPSVRHIMDAAAPRRVLDDRLPPRTGRHAKEPASLTRIAQETLRIE